MLVVVAMLVVITQPPGSPLGMVSAIDKFGVVPVIVADADGTRQHRS